MNARKRANSEAHAPLTRRAFGQTLGRAALAWTAMSATWMPALRATAENAPSVSTSPPEPSPAAALPRELVENSPYVYISPLHANGKESTCHAELWYAWLDDSVVVTVAADRWKAKALAQGLGRARIWMGDHGRWKTWYGGRNEAFRKAVRFDARVERIADASVLESLLARYETKYPEEVADWRDLMREGNADGSRVMLRYTPIHS